MSILKRLQEILVPGLLFLWLLVSCNQGGDLNATATAREECPKRNLYFSSSPELADSVSDVVDSESSSPLVNSYLQDGLFALARIYDPGVSNRAERCVEWVCQGKERSVVFVPFEDVETLVSIVTSERVEATSGEAGDCVGQQRWALARVRLELWEPFKHDEVDFELAVRVLITGKIETELVPLPASEVTILEEVALAFAARGQWWVAGNAIDFALELAKKTEAPLREEMIRELEAKRQVIRDREAM